MKLIRAGWRTATSAQFLRFLLTSLASVVINLLTRSALNAVVGYEAAVALAYVVGMAVSFVLAKMFVFQGSKNRVSGEVARYVAVNAIGLVQIWTVSVVLLRAVMPAVGFGWRPELVAHFLGLASLACTAFFLHKRITFREAVDPTEEVVPS